jgi:FtsP/CotA-like multicopper oxidase with cupredoxin domain
MAGDGSDPTHDFEVSMRGFTGEASAHFTRLIDLTMQGNTIGENQHGGEFVQFHAPLVPYSHVNGTEAGHHKNTLAMHVRSGEFVRVVIQLQDRAAHPWHLHGHKFAVLGVGFPNYTAQCDVLFCRSSNNHWLSRDGFPALLDPSMLRSRTQCMCLRVVGW